MENLLDVLPDDVHDRIAYHLFSLIECEEDDFIFRRYTFCDKEGLQSFLNYAQIGPSQRRAVLRAMSWSLCITGSWKRQTVLDYIFMSANELLELDIFEASRFTFAGDPPILPKLRKAVIDTLPEQLSLVFGSPKLTELGVIVSTIRRWDSVVSTIASIPLKVFNLVFLSFLQNGIAKNELRDLSQMQCVRLCTACSGVESFFLNPGKSPITADAWDMIKAFPSLKILGLKLDTPIDDALQPFIRSLSELEVYHIRIEEAQRLGANITSLGILPASNNVQILRLASLPNLRKLEITLGERNERALAGVVENIEHLCLSFLFDYEENLLEYLEDLDYPTYYEPDEAALNGTLQRAWKLRALQIEKAILSADVIEKILQNIGGRLESLALCFDWQKESAATRMERILKAVVRYCPKLKFLNFLESSRFFRSPILATEEEKRRCRRALREVTSVLPWFESYRVISYIIEHRFTDRKPENMLLWHDILPDS